MLEVPKKIIDLQLKVARRVAALVTGRNGASPSGPARTAPTFSTSGVSPGARSASSPMGAPGLRDHISYGGAAAAVRTSPAAGTVALLFEERGLTAHVEPGTTILEAAMAMDIDLNHYCGGMSACGSCRVEVVDGGGQAVSEMEDLERTTLDMVKENPTDRLGCQVRVRGPVTVRVPPQD